MLLNIKDLYSFSFSNFLLFGFFILRISNKEEKNRNAYFKYKKIVYKDYKKKLKMNNVKV